MRNHLLLQKNRVQLVLSHLQFTGSISKRAADVSLSSSSCSVASSLSSSSPDLIIGCPFGRMRNSFVPAEAIPHRLIRPFQLKIPNSTTRLFQPNETIVLLTRNGSKTSTLTRASTCLLSSLPDCLSFPSFAQSIFSSCA